MQYPAIFVQGKPPLPGTRKPAHSRHIPPSLIRKESSVQRPAARKPVGRRHPPVGFPHDVVVQMFQVGLRNTLPATHNLQNGKRDLGPHGLDGEGMAEPVRVQVRDTGPADQPLQCRVSPSTTRTAHTSRHRSTSKPNSARNEPKSSEAKENLPGKNWHRIWHRGRREHSGTPRRPETPEDRNSYGHHAPGRSKTPRDSRKTVFETGASTIPPLRHSYEFAAQKAVSPELSPDSATLALQDTQRHSEILSHPPGQGGPQVFKRLGRGAFEAAFREWVRGESGGQEDAVAIDGKSLRVFMARNCREGIWWRHAPINWA